jgi:hypothetical protein
MTIVKVTEKYKEFPLKILICKPRLDISFKHMGPPPPKREKLLQPEIRIHWKNFVESLTKYHNDLKDDVVVLEKPCFQFTVEDVDKFGADLVYVPHVEKKYFGGDQRYRYYMQTVFPWLFTIDTEGWTGGASFLKELPTENDNGKTFKEFQKRIETGESKFNQPEYKFVNRMGEYIFVPLQLPHDKTIKFHSRVGVEEMAIRLAEWGDRYNKNIIFKSHPANPGSLVELGSRLSTYKNSRFIDNDVNIHSVIAQSKAVYVINSGVGLEAMLHEKPIVRFGDAEYNNTVFKGDLNNLSLAWAHCNRINNKYLKDSYEKFYNWYVNKICYDTRR